MANKFLVRYKVLALLFFLILITYLDRVCISIVGVRIKSEFKLSNEQFGWVLGAFVLAYALFEIPSGMLGDRIGQRKVLIRIVLWWSLFTALTGLTTGLITLICARFLFGMGESGAFPNSSGVVFRWFPSTETARGISSLFAGLNVGAAIGPLIIVPMALSFGWRAPFFLNGFIGLIWVLVCYKWFRNKPSEMKSITAEEIKFIEQNRQIINHQKIFPWETVIKSRTAWAMVTSFFCSQWGLYFFVAWMPVYLQQGRHFSENEMKLITSGLFIVGIVGALTSGFFCDWLVKNKGLVFGRRLVGFLALGGMGLSFLAVATISSNLIALICLITAGLFPACFGIVAFSTCVDIGDEHAGTVAGIMNFAGQVGAFFLAIVFGKIVDVTHSFNAPLFLISGILLIGGFTWLTVNPKEKIAPIESIDKQIMLSI
jgi:MFS transporter, ACS family, glucarate transporter